MFVSLAVSPEQSFSSSLFPKFLKKWGFLCTLAPLAHGLSLGSSDLKSSVRLSFKIAKLETGLEKRGFLEDAIMQYLMDPTLQI